jgi:hypothetical protein
MRRVLGVLALLIGAGILLTAGYSLLTGGAQGQNPVRGIFLALLFLSVGALWVRGKVVTPSRQVEDVRAAPPRGGAPYRPAEPDSLLRGDLSRLTVPGWLLLLSLIPLTITGIALFVVWAPDAQQLLRGWGAGLFGVAVVGLMASAWTLGRWTLKGLGIPVWRKD